jgi:hypothetical protein
LRLTGNFATDRQHCHWRVSLHRATMLPRNITPALNTARATFNQRRTTTRNAAPATLNQRQRRIRSVIDGGSS